MIHSAIGIDEQPAYRVFKRNVANSTADRAGSGGSTVRAAGPGVKTSIADGAPS